MNFSHVFEISHEKKNFCKGSRELKDVELEDESNEAVLRIECIEIS